MPKIFLVFLDILGFIIFCNLILIPLNDFTTAIVFKPFKYLISVQF